jgi:hypothetical protein
MNIKIKCHGQDESNFDPEGVGDHPCPRCGRQVEFFPTDRSRKCPGCGARFGNPSLDLGHAKECVDFASPSEKNAEGVSKRSERTEKIS